MNLESQRVKNLPTNYNLNDINSEEELLKTISDMTVVVSAIRNDVKLLAGEVESLVSRVETLENP